MFTRWWIYYKEREHAKHVLKTRLYSNYLTHYTGSDTQGSQEFIPNFSFTCRQFDMVPIRCPLPSDLVTRQKSSGRSPLYQ